MRPNRRSAVLAAATAILATTAGLSLTPLAGCARNAATGKSQFNMLSRADEIALGEEAAPGLTAQYGGSVSDQYLQDYVTRVGMSMVPHTEGDYSELPWEFTLLDSTVINAFALPGGKVFVSRALVQEMDNEAQLAGVLGHEIGHVTAEHADKRVSSQMIAQGIAIGIGLGAQMSDDDLIRVGLPVLAGAGSQGFLLKFGRDEELEADALGMRYMERAGYNPIGQYQVMKILAEAAGGGGQPEILSTHPHPETRMKRIQKRLDTDLAYTQNNPSYQIYEDRFQTEFLARLNSLPAPQQAIVTPPEAIACTCYGCGCEAESVATVSDASAR